MPIKWEVHHHFPNLGGFPQMRLPQARWIVNGKSQSKMVKWMISRYPHFRKPPYVPCQAYPSAKRQKCAAVGRAGRVVELRVVVEGEENLDVLGI